MKRFPTNRLRLFDETNPVDRLEVLEGPTGRRSWPDDVKVRIVLESLEPGARVCDVARRHGLTPQHLSTWRSLARKGKRPLPVDEEALPAFASIEVAEDEVAMEVGAIEIALGELVIRLSPTTPASRIAEIAMALRQSR